jgi:hypothetical protein
MISTASFSTELLQGESSIRAVNTDLAELRTRCSQADDLTTDIDYFLATCPPRNRRPVVLLFRAKSRPEAAVLLHEVCFKGIGTGLCRAGDPAGDGLVVAPPAAREEFLSLAVKYLVMRHKTFHTVRACMKTAKGLPMTRFVMPGFTSKLIDREVKHTLPLNDSYSALLQEFGQRTRRSLRTKRRQLEERFQPSFFADLSPAQALEAMGYLRTHSSPIRSLWFINARRSLLLSRKDAFAMGLQSVDGSWLSFLSGWRAADTTYVDLQMNNQAFKGESISAVMRAFLLENEIERGQRYITFVGGSSALLERYCTPNESIVDIIVSRASVRGWCLKKLINKCCDESLKYWLYM